MTKYNALLFAFIFALAACGSKNDKDSNNHKTKNDQQGIKTNRTDSHMVEVPGYKEDQSSDLATTDFPVIEAMATVVSVKEELIMPADYLTTAMTVSTASNDTLVFLDMEGFDSLVGQQINIKYQFKPGAKLLLCFDCESYDGQVSLYDITATISEVDFELLKLNKYEADDIIAAASTYLMEDEYGIFEQYSANDTQMIKDSARMANGFYNYGYVTKLSPKLLNEEELKQQINR